MGFLTINSLYARKLGLRCTVQSLINTCISAVAAVDGSKLGRGYIAGTAGDDAAPIAKVTQAQRGFTLGGSPRSPPTFGRVYSYRTEFRRSLVLWSAGVLQCFTLYHVFYYYFFSFGDRGVGTPCCLVCAAVSRRSFLVARKRRRSDSSRHGLG